MEEDETIRKVRGDSPLESLEQDEFGLTEMVDGVAAMLATQTPDDGFTLGIEGSWGSGKSTFANFVADKLRQYENHFVIRFEPWLIGEKSALIASFLGQFASEIDKLSPQQWRWWQYRRWQGLWRSSRLSKRIRKYGGYLGALSAPVAGAATMDPTGSTALAATGLKTAGLLSRLFGREETLDELKFRIVTDLCALHKQRRNLRFTVLIDDTDRLDAIEAVEILRLIRKAADFPYVSHVVCFDLKILSQQVSTALSIKDGRKYLDRIFQDIIHVPPQEPFALRRYLKRLLRASFPAEMTEQDIETEYRMEMVFDRWCGRLLNTPRDVVRLHQAIQFSWPHVPKGSDFSDFVWLQLLKLTCEDFYQWVRNYLQNVGSYRDRGRPGDSEAADQGKQLLKLLKRFGWHERMFLSGIDDMLPGLKSTMLANENEAFKVFEFESGELERFEHSRRLGSPSHWTGYFAFTLPSYAIKDEELSALQDAFLTDPAEAARLIREVLDRPHERAGHFLDVLLDRLLDAPGRLSEKESDGLLRAFAEVMDDVERTTRFTFKEGRNEIWDKTRFLLRKCRPTNLLSAIKNGASVNWLAHILRDQGFALGKPKGHRSNPEGAWVQLEIFDEAVQILVGRFEALGMKAIFALPSPMDVLFCWVQLGNSEDVRARFQEATKSHTDFLTALNAMRGWSNNSDTGVNHPLPAAYVAQLMDPQAAHDRLNSLASRGKPKHKALAESLLAQWHPLEPQSSVVPV